VPNPDPFLHAGLTPSTDVELYESAATGGGTNTPVTVSTTATGVATVARVLTLGRSATATATGTPTVARSLTLGRAFEVTATGVATESHTFIPVGGEPEPPPVLGQGYGGPPLATYYVQAFSEFPTPCQCHKGRPSKACRLHCKLIKDRQKHEEELLVLALV